MSDGSCGSVFSSINLLPVSVIRPLILFPDDWLRQAAAHRGFVPNS
jgi:hypothetical protein